MNFIDYSQYKAWCRCPWYWYERYVTGVRKKREGQQRDALTIGSLVHGGLENWHKNGTPTIPDSIVPELNPTPDCLVLASEMVEQYVRLYPNEDWDMQRLEEPVTFELNCPDLNGLAKLDAYFYNPSQREIESGLPGYTLSLSPGWWVREYKTKDASVDRARWNQGWEVNMQAAFQMLALQEKVGETPQGVLISVLEKPRQYIPKRKCRGCGEMIEMGLYLATPDGQSACPMCGEIQKLAPYEPKTRVQPQFYRVVAVRNGDQLNQAKVEITTVAEEMQSMENSGAESLDINRLVYNSFFNRENCAHPIFGLCEYYKPHVYNIGVDEDETLEQHEPTKYVGLPEAA